MWPEVSPVRGEKRGVRKGKCNGNSPLPLPLPLPPPLSFFFRRQADEDEEEERGKKSPPSPFSIDAKNKTDKSQRRFGVTRRKDTYSSFLYIFL